MFERYQLFRRAGVGGIFYEAAKDGRTVCTITSGNTPDRQQTIVVSGPGNCTLHSNYDFSGTIAPGACRHISFEDEQTSSKDAVLLVWSGGSIHQLQIGDGAKFTVSDEKGEAIFRKSERKIAVIRNAKPHPVGTFPLAEHYYETAKMLDVEIASDLSDLVRGLVLSFPMMKLGADLNRNSFHEITVAGKQIHATDCYYFDQSGEPCHVRDAASCVIREYDRDGKLVREAWESLPMARRKRAWDALISLFRTDSKQL